mmetsp:Transcript_7483/g.16376  ORF Transcript_7483/g.16376 Transcript_7483/m.16376 type:complete len:338 (+) Transcript_7483:627-1640(+)
MKDILHGLSKRPGIEKMLDGIDLKSPGFETLPHPLLFVLVHGILLLRESSAILLVSFPALLVEHLVDGGNIALDGAKLVPILVLVLLVKLFWLFLLFVLFLLDDTLLALLTFLGDVYHINGTVQEGNTGWDGIETNSHLHSERTPVKVGGRANLGRKLTPELLDEPAGVVALDLHEFVNLPRGPPTDQLEIVAIKDGLAGVPDVVKEPVVLSADLVKCVRARDLQFVPHLALHDLVLQLPLSLAEGPPLLVGLARLLHHLDLLGLLLLLPAAATAGGVVVVVTILFLASTGPLLVPATSPAAGGGLGTGIVALVVVVVRLFVVGGPWHGGGFVLGAV